jgi:phosphoenolpyruvate carboxykinase (ATP)
VDSGILDPRSTWADKAAYDARAASLVAMFNENFKTFEAHVAPYVRAAAPKVRELTAAE